MPPLFSNERASLVLSSARHYISLTGKDCAMAGLRFGLIVAALAVSTYSALAQRDNSLPGSSLEISGQVRLANGQAQVPIQNILIRVERFGSGLVDQTTPDSNGRFRFSGLGPGQYTISISSPDFTAERQQVDLDTRIVRRAQVFLQLTPEKPKSVHNASNPTEVLDARVPVEARKEFEKGRVAMLEKTSEKDQAILHLEKAITLYPNFFEALLMLGTTYMDMQQWSKAEIKLRRATEINPKATFAFVALGDVCRRQKKYADAEKVLQEGLNLDDNSWQGHFTLGRVYWEAGNLAKAGFQVGRTLQLMPDLADAHLLAGNIFMRASLPENALIEYEEYLRLSPKGEFSDQAQEIAHKLKRALAEKKK